MTDTRGRLSLNPRDQEHLARLARRDGGCFVSDLPLSSAAYVTGALFEVLPSPLVIVLEGPRAMDEFLRNMTTLHPHLLPAYYPPWESLPGQGERPVADLVGDRLDVLHRCLEPVRPSPIITCIQALMQKTLSPAELQRARMIMTRSQEYDFHRLLEQLQTAGYAFEPEVSVKGHAAHRGGIIDCWPITETWPVRLEFFGDVLDSIRSFDPENQRSIERHNEIVITPAKEASADHHSPDRYAATLLDYLPDHTGWAWVNADRIRDHALQYEILIEDADASAYTTNYRGLRAAIRKHHAGATLHMGGHKPKGAEPADLIFFPLAGLPSLDRADMPTDALEEERHRFLDELERHQAEGHDVQLYFGTQGTLDRFIEWRMPRRDPRSRFTLQVGPLSEGFHYPAHQLIVLSELDLYGKRRELRGRYDPHARRPGPKKIGGLRFSEWRDIQPGELVVHIEHGIGRYLGLYEITVHDQWREVLTIEYADKAKIFLPVSQAHLLSRYVGFGKQRPNLHALGGKRWSREKIAAERAVRDLAAMLLDTQAARHTLRGHAFSADSAWQHEFEATFPFEETEDQLRAIREVKEDMESPRPMDRLICGDVGYGKTEVALRAAFKAVMDGRQVVMLVPTTVLAQQHYETFKDRMAAFPVRIEMLSRFRTRAEQRAIVRELNEGRLDMVIGTHRLIQPDVIFKNLGLVIIDEEQRFGVEHKEHLKTLRRLVDVLTMTATPIPRTLYMSLTGARDISTIQTPPQERVPVETIVTEPRDDLIRDAIHRELSRDGQVFYLHNRVQSIESARKRLMKLVPEARIAVGHGQMHERELESVMAGFVRGDYDILLCTTIIESGVDIPNVNTIFIERADRFGLSDLYQLRGRVGRYKHKAYAYLLLPKHGRLFSAARDRVQAIRKYSGLGSGFKLALRDLEIRGAGNILGAEQSGHIAAVGFDLYCQFLQRTIARMKGETPPPIIDVGIRLDFINQAPSHAEEDNAAVIPVTYVEDENMRVTLYRRLAGIGVLSEVRALREELRDRLGPPPHAMERLLKITEVRLLAHQKEITDIETRENKIMMKRRGDFLMRNKRFPRLTANTASERLDELLELVRTWEMAG